MLLQFVFSCIIRSESLKLLKKYTSTAASCRVNNVKWKAYIFIYIKSLGDFHEWRTIGREQDRDLPSWRAASFFGFITMINEPWFRRDCGFPQLLMNRKLLCCFLFFFLLLLPLLLELLVHIFQIPRESHAQPSFHFCAKMRWPPPRQTFLQGTTDTRYLTFWNLSSVPTRQTPRFPSNRSSDVQCSMKGIADLWKNGGSSWKSTGVSVYCRCVVV